MPVQRRRGKRDPPPPEVYREFIRLCTERKFHVPIHNTVVPDAYFIDESGSGGIEAFKSALWRVGDVIQPETSWLLAVPMSELHRIFNQWQSQKYDFRFRHATSSEIINGLHPVMLPQTETFRRSVSKPIWLIDRISYWMSDEKYSPRMIHVRPWNETKTRLESVPLMDSDAGSATPDSGAVP